MLTVDARCTMGSCPDKNIYRMVGSCSNCGVKDVLILLTVGHESSDARECPTCGCRWLRAQRLATEDEIPVG